MIVRRLFVVGGLAAAFAISTVGPALAEDLSDYFDDAADAIYSGQRLVGTTWDGIESVGMVEIQHHGQVTMAPADGDLVDGDPPQVPQPGSAEPTLEFGLQDRLHQVPAHPEVLGHIPHRHALGQLQHVAGEPVRVAMLVRRERNLGLPYRPARLALQARHLQLDPNRPAPDGKAAEAPHPPAFSDHPAIPTYAAPELLIGLSDGKVDLAPDVGGPLIEVAVNAKSVVQ